MRSMASIAVNRVGSFPDRSFRVSDKVYVIGPSRMRKGFLALGTTLLVLVSLARHGSCGDNPVV